MESKLELIAGMAGHCTAVLVDPVWSFGQGVLTGALPRHVGLISGLERLAYTPPGSAPRPRCATPGRSRRSPGSARTLPSWSSSTARSSRTSPRSSTSWSAALSARVRRARAAAGRRAAVVPASGRGPRRPGGRLGAVRRDGALGRRLRRARRRRDQGRVPRARRRPGSRGRRGRSLRRLDAGLDVPWVLLSASATFEQFEPSCGSPPLRAPAASWQVARSGATRWAGTTRRRRAAGVATACDRLDRARRVLREHGRGWPVRRRSPTRPGCCRPTGTSRTGRRDRLVVAGPAGSGKSTLGRALARARRRGAARPRHRSPTRCSTRLAVGSPRAGTGTSPGTATSSARRATPPAAWPARDQVLDELVLVAPFTAELAGGPEWDELVQAVAPRAVRVIWLDATADLLHERLAVRADPRDRHALPGGAPPDVPHLRVDAAAPTADQLEGVLSRA